MKGIALSILILTAFLVSTAQPGFAGAPHQIAGFVLGSDVKGYEGAVKMDTSLPIRYREYLAEVEVKPFDGFRTGYIVYGTCQEGRQITRIRLKYEREDKGFFEELLTEFKKKFGEPKEYKGDVFRSYVAWKWSFTDDKNNRISLILQYGTDEEDGELPRGTTVKLTQVSLMEKERECYEKKHPELAAEPQGAVRKTGEKKLDWKQLIPE